MRKEQPPQRLNSEQTAFEDGNSIHQAQAAKGNGLPPLPKTLNHYFSDTTHFSSQHTAESSSEVSSGVSTDRTTSSQAQISSNGGNQYNVTNSSRGSSKLFKGVSLCPPIAPKTMISPNLDKQGNHHNGHSGSGGAVETSTGSSQKQLSSHH